MVTRATALTAALLLSSTTWAATPSHGGAGGSHSSAPAPRPLPKPKPRSPVELQRGSPLGRPPPVVTHNHGGVHFWAEPAVFLPAVIWAPVTVPEPAPDQLYWESGQNFFPENGWTENVYEVPNGGEKLLMTFDAPLQFDFIEVVYQDGTAQTIDLSGPARPAGTYGVVDLDPNRAVDHIRVIALATAGISHLTLEAK